MNPIETRSSHPSSAQVETLVEFMERNPGMAKGFLRTQNARERSRRQWEELAVRLNSIGGTIKTYKQWTKYWSDKKSAIKKKVAARSAARRRTGGGVEDEVELSELEERVVALCGGESFSTGDAHLGIQPFPENNTPSPSHEVQQIEGADTDNVHVPLQQQSQAPSEESSAIVFYDSNLIEDNQEQRHNYRPPDRAILRRRLFASSSSSTVGTSQSILRNNQLEHTPPPNPHVYHPSLSPPTVTLSHTPTPSPSRRGSTQVASPVIHRTAASSSSRNAASVASRNAASVASRNAASVASPSRRPRTVRGSRGGSVSSRHTSSVAAPPPSQRRTEFSTITDRFLRVEEQQLELQRSNHC
ncbi:hypothetical protein PYW08_005986 [Mythimna loreyi]|uniref:Uncharacterized protein n=1 Tax=Mythimna loreyi TaxID=667449 RepID=A0ACC2QLS3_9NEOP|nr:hypothetical protein PYW08_005986 [Mythimna loreyi]